jgi:iron(III) transport system substrate-binding protein
MYKSKEMINVIKQLASTMTIALFFVVSGCKLSDENTVVLVTPAPVSEIEEQIDAFNVHYPDIRVETMYLGVGEITTRIRAEGRNPQIDVASDIPVSYIIQNPDLFHSYVSEEDEAYAQNLKDSENHTWYGHYSGPQVILVNTNLIPDARQKIKGWNDLKDPEYRGEIILANPSLSSSAFDQLRLMVTIGGWDLVESVLQNSVITPSSRLAYQGVADGEYAIGMLTENIAVNLVNDGYPVVFIYPEEGTNETLTGLSIVENSPNYDNAKILFEFLNSRESHQIAASAPYFRRTARTDVELHPDMLPTKDIPFAVSLSEIMAFTPDRHEAMLERFDELMADM